MNLSIYNKKFSFEYAIELLYDLLTVTLRIIKYNKMHIIDYAYSHILWGKAYI